NEARQAIRRRRPPAGKSVSDTRRMGDGFWNLLEEPLLDAVIVGEAEGPSDIEREIAFAVGGADLRRETAEGKALFDMAHARAEPFGNGIDAHAVIDEPCERFHFVHGVHGDALDVLGE